MLKKQTGQAPSLIKAVAWGTGVAVVFALVWAMGLAKLIDGQMMQMEKVGYGTMAAHLTAVFMGTMASYRRGGHMGLIAAAVTGAMYYLVLLLINALFFGGHYAGLGTTLVLVFISTGLAIWIAGKGSGSKRKRNYKIPRG